MTLSRIKDRAEWPRFPFEEVIKDATGGNPKTQVRDYQPRGTFPIIDQGQELIGGYTDDPNLLCRVPIPAILFGDHTRTFKYIEHPFALGADGVKVLIPKKDLDPRFAYHFLTTLKLPIDAGYSRHYKFLKRFNVPVPPDKEEQRRIAAILDKADAIRRKRRQALAETDTLLRSVFLDMFGDPVTNPKCWPINKLGALLARPPRIGTIVPATGVGNLRIVKVGQLGSLYVDLMRCEQTALTEKEIQRFQARPSDLLLARAIGSEAHLGKASIVPDMAGNLVFDSHVMRLTFRKSQVDPCFFWFWLTSKGGRQRFMQKAGPTAVQFNINSAQIADVSVPVAPLAKQQAFAKVVARCICQNKSRSDPADNGDHLFQALSQRAFRGEL